MDVASHKAVLRLCAVLLACLVPACLVPASAFAADEPAAAPAAESAGNAAPTSTGSIEFLDARPRAVTLDQLRKVPRLRVVVRNNASQAQTVKLRIVGLRALGEDGKTVVPLFTRRAALVRIGPHTDRKIKLASDVGAAMKLAPASYEGELVARGSRDGIARLGFTLTVEKPAAAAAPAPSTSEGQLAPQFLADEFKLTATNYAPSWLSPWPAALFFAGLVVMLLGAVRLWFGSRRRGASWVAVVAGLAAFVAGIVLLIDANGEPPRVLAEVVAPSVALVPPAAPAKPAADVKPAADAKPPPAKAVGEVADDAGHVAALVSKDSRLHVEGLGPAGTYTGKLDLNGDEAGSAKATVEVRDWWFYAALVLAAGVALAAWLVRWYSRGRSSSEEQARVEEAWQAVADQEASFLAAHGQEPYGGYVMDEVARARLKDARQAIEDGKPEDARKIVDDLRAYRRRVEALRKELGELAAERARLLAVAHLGHSGIPPADLPTAGVFGSALEVLERGLDPADATDPDDTALKEAEDDVAVQRTRLAEIAALHAAIAGALARIRALGADSAGSDTWTTHESALRRAAAAVLRAGKTDDLAPEKKALAEALADLDADDREPVFDRDPEILYATMAGPIRRRIHAPELRDAQPGDGAPAARRSIAVEVWAAAGRTPTSEGGTDDPFVFSVVLDLAALPDARTTTITWEFGDGERAVQPVSTTGAGLRVQTAHRYATPGKRTVRLLADDALELADPAEVTVQKGPGVAASLRAAFEKADAQATLITGAVATGSGLGAVYFADADWGQPKDYLAAFLWGATVSEGLKLISLLASKAYKAAA